VVVVNDHSGQDRVVLRRRQDDGAVAVDLAALAEQRQDAIRGSEPSTAVGVHAPPLLLFV
jgi:hypothetical protein